jgi:phage N-6-adenine-methyltransferase
MTPEMQAEIVTVGEAERLAVLEQVIADGLQTFVDVGNALLEIRDGRLYRTTHGTFEDYCRERWGMVRRHADRLIEAASVAENLRPIGLIPATESQARPLTHLPPDLQREVWQQAVETAPNGRVTAAHVQTVVYEYTRPPGHVTVFDEYGAQETYTPSRPLPLTAANHAPSFDPDYDGDEWYTPADYLESVRAVLGAIDLDPATSEEAQAVVQARTYYTKQDDGLAQPWAGRVFMNPPYSTPLIQQFTDRIVQEYAAGNVTEAIILTNNSSETRWFQSLLRLCPVCFPASRLRFWRAGADVFGARQGQALFYLGPNGGRFCEVFARHGVVMEAV